MSAERQAMTTRQLAAALAKVRDNDLRVDVDGINVPVVGLHYAALPDIHVLDLDPTRVEDAVLASDIVAALDGALYSVWLHGDWFQLTRSMTTEQREAAAEAVHRHEATVDEPDAPGNRGIDDRPLRWWAPEYRYNIHRVDTWRIVAGARIEAESQDNGRWVGEVRRRGGGAVLLAHCHRSACTSTATFAFDQIVRVISSPVDPYRARLDAADTPKEA